MPLYEFRCAYCDYLFERLQSADADNPSCPRCGFDTQRLISSGNLRFRGHGFYCTDYGKHGPRK